MTSLSVDMKRSVDFYDQVLYAWVLTGIRSNSVSILISIGLPAFNLSTLLLWIYVHLTSEHLYVNTHVLELTHVYYEYTCT